MTPLERHRWQLRLINASFVALLLLAIGLLFWISREYRLRVDLTRAASHSLSPASIAAVQGLRGPARVTAYASERDELRRAIREYVGRYQKHKKDLVLEFVDPDTSPQQVREAGIQNDGELVIEHNGAREHIAPQRLNEQNLTNAFTRLGHREERWVVFLAGHGERSAERGANFDLSLWAQEMQKRGFRARSLSLGDHPQLPQNTAVLVIAGPRARLLPGEIREIERYLAAGGNLLWLHDPGPLQGLERIAERLGIEFAPGVIVDPRSARITRRTTAVVVARYGQHPAVRNFGEQTVLIDAAGILIPDNSDRRADADRWQRQVLFDTRAEAWSETGALRGQVTFDKGRDTPGPLNLAVAFTREGAASTGPRDRPAARQQRVIVVGDGDFLANQYLANAGNLELGLSLLNWLSRDDAYVNIPVRTAADRMLALSRNTWLVMFAAFLVLLPAVFVTGGVLVWRRRRRR
jgi:ABC-type uncharacterized transport system involved in gliding motility auxiliary subunit